MLGDAVGSNHEGFFAVATKVALGPVLAFPVLDDVDAPAMRARPSVNEPTLFYILVKASGGTAGKNSGLYDVLLCL